MKLTALKSLLGTGRMASVDFVTKKGKLRTINGRTGVKRYLKGGTSRRKTTPESKGQLIIWETLRPQDKVRDGQKRYRTVTAEQVRAVRADGVEIKPR
jgi:hypothetical protein